MKWYYVIGFLALCFFLGDIGFKRNKCFYGKVVDKSFSPTSNETEVDIENSNKDGKQESQTTVKTNHKNAEWVLVTKNCYEVDEVSCNKYLYYNVKLQDTILYEYRCGFFTNHIYQTIGLKKK